MVDGSGEQDELDRLMQEYERQAREDCEAALRKTKKRRTAEEETKESLQRPLPKENKGYKMLEKLGFKEGEGLGVRKQGITEPLSLSRHSRREGLGSFSLKDRPKAPEFNPAGRLLLERCIRRGLLEATAEYRQRVALSLKSKRAAKMLMKARRLIENLDKQLDFERNPFWLPAPPSDDTSEAEVDELQSLTVDDGLQAALAYLREQHTYCLWCGTQYKDAAEMRLKCPGVNEEDHE